MGKRLLEYCDNCKEEADLSHTLQIKKGKKAGRSYDICASCASFLEQKLVSENKIVATTATKRTTLGDLEEPSSTPPVDDDARVAEFLARSPRQTKSDQVMQTTEESCRHLNKGRITFKNKVPHQQCHQCGLMIQYTGRVNPSKVTTGGFDIKTKDI